MMQTECKYSKKCNKFDSHFCNKNCLGYIFLHGTGGKGGLWQKKNLPPIYNLVTKEELNKKGKHFQQVKKYINEIEKNYCNGTGLFLHGIPFIGNALSLGTGKTLSASIVINEFIFYKISKILEDKKVKNDFAYFIKMSEFQHTYNLQFTEDFNYTAIKTYKNYLNLMYKARLLVIDDIAIRSATANFVNELYCLIDYRISKKLMTVYTSNYPLEKIANYYDERIVSRIEGSTYKIPFCGKDWRKDN